MNNKDTIINIGTLYEMNQQVVLQSCSPLTKKDIQIAQEQIRSWFKDNQIRYAMLLCKDISYYTVFSSVKSDYIFAAEQCIGCLEDQKMDIVDITLQKDNTWEIWLRNSKQKQVFAFYLFDYKAGIIEF